MYIIILQNVQFIITECTTPITKCTSLLNGNKPSLLLQNVQQIDTTIQS